MESDRKHPKQKGEIGHDGRWKEVMRDEKEWWEIKRSDERRKGAIGDEKKWWEDEMEWWETKWSDERQKEMMGSK